MTREPVCPREGTYPEGDRRPDPRLEVDCRATVMRITGGGRGHRLGLALCVSLLWASCAVGDAPSEPPPPLTPTRVAGFTPAKFSAGIYKNIDPEYRRASYSTRLRFLVLGGASLFADHHVAALPLAVPDTTALRANAHEPTVTWIGHSTVLVQLDGVSFLTDPTWAHRSGPFGGSVGVSRYTPPPMRIEDLPPISFVLISHDHYDHLDEPTVRRLAELYNPVFVVPMGIKEWLADRHIDNAVELNWGQAVTIRGLTIVCTPAQHGSGRTLLDQGRRLWSSWVVVGSKRFYFPGDTGYYRHFQQTGDLLGPFDLAALPIGSYTPPEIARPVHLSPEDAVQAAIDLRATHLLAIHWGTFALARERYDEPPKRLAAEVERRHLDRDAAWVLHPGETVPW